MEIVKYNKNDKEIIEKVVDCLKKGGLIIYPTETTYGLGTDPTNEKAVRKLLKYKKRREGKPLSIAVSSLKMAKEYCEINTAAKNLYKNFLPGPLTIVSNGKGKTVAGVAAENGTLGIRMPDYQLILDIIGKFKKPITATSANASYKKRPYSIGDVLNNISDRQKSLIDLIIDAGELPHNEPSTIVDTTLNDYSILRQGDITLTNFEKVISNSEEETKDFAFNLIDKYKKDINNKGIIFALQGDMGAGKTQFAKGIANYLGIKKVVSSPTFLLQKNYSFEFNNKSNIFSHIDTWRMFSKEELEELKINECIKDNNIIVIEWADKVYSLIKSFKDMNVLIIWIKFKAINENSREIIYTDKL